MKITAARNKLFAAQFSTNLAEMLNVQDNLKSMFVGEVALAETSIRSLNVILLLCRLLTALSQRRQHIGTLIFNC